MIIGVPKETYPGECRVALTPAVVPLLAKAGLEVVLEAGAGEQAGYPDAQYQEKGAKILPERGAVFAQSDIIVQVLCHGANDKTGASDLSLMRPGQVLVGFLRPLGSPDSVPQVAKTGVSSYAVELL
ncbi:MAG: NAD(P)(+) transhydrogenase (Re/Si-specific) subunit alpha, partial [Candidatus Angelobacter sp.]